MLQSVVGVFVNVFRRRIEVGTMGMRVVPVEMMMAVGVSDRFMDVVVRVPIDGKRYSAGNTKRQRRPGERPGALVQEGEAPDEPESRAHGEQARVQRRADPPQGQQLEDEGKTDSDSTGQHHECPGLGCE